MAVAKLKYPKEDRLERLADRVANEINARAAKMTPEDRAKADSETAKIATQVRRSNSLIAAIAASISLFK